MKIELIPELLKRNTMDNMPTTAPERGMKWVLYNDIWTQQLDKDYWDNLKKMSKERELVNHPSHYGGENNPYEAIKVIHAWDLGFDLGNTVKYISRAGKKDPTKEIEDLEKAAWYLNSRIKLLKENGQQQSGNTGQV